MFRVSENLAFWLVLDIIVYFLYNNDNDNINKEKTFYVCISIQEQELTEILHRSRYCQHFDGSADKQIQQAQQEIGDKSSKLKHVKSELESWANEIRHMP